MVALHYAGTIGLTTALVEWKGGAEEPAGLSQRQARQVVLGPPTLLCHYSSKTAPSVAGRGSRRGREAAEGAVLLVPCPGAAPCLSQHLQYRVGLLFTRDAYMCSDRHPSL